MTENNTPEAPDTTTQDITVQEGANQSETTPEEHSNKAAAEAKKYRHKLREAEAALEAANNRVETLQTAEVERLATEQGLVKPATIWLSGMTLETVRDQDGNIDPDLAREHIRAAQENLGLGINPTPQPNPAQFAEGIGHDPADDWQDSFKL